MTSARSAAPFAFFLVVACVARGAEMTPSDAPVVYTLDASAAAAGRVHVRLALPAPAAAPIELVVPRGYPGGYSIVPYDRFVENARAAAPGGASVSAARAPEGPRWRFGKAGERVAAIDYDVDVARMEKELRFSVETSKARPRYAGILGWSVFGFVDGFEDREVALEVVAPAEWPILSTLSPSLPAARGRTTARAPDYASLADAEILMGPDLQLSLVPGAIPLVFAGFTEGGADLALEAELARTALDRVQTYFGDTPIARYTVQLEILAPLPDHGYNISQEHRESGTFSLSLDSALTAASGAAERSRALQNYAHHMAHSWIPKRAYPLGYAPHRWELPPVLDAIWFNEGFARYASIQALADGMAAAEGAAFRARALERLRAILEEAPPFLRRMSLVELSRTASFQYAADFRVGKSTFARGALMAAEMDDHIRAATGGARSLKDALRALLKSPQPFRIEDLPRLFADATGADVRDVFARWTK